MIKVIAFDLDDTLWEVDPVLIEAERILRQWLEDAVPGLTYDRETVGQIRREVAESNPGLIGRPTDFRRSVIEQTLKRADLEHASAESVSHEAMAVFLEARSRLVLFEGVRETMVQLASRFTLGALTNGNADITRVGLDEVFNFVFSAEDVAAPKPSPDLFLAALKHTGTRPPEMVYVGDHPQHDIDAANNVGLQTIWVDNGIKQREKGETDADEIVSHVTEVPAAVERMLSRQ
jgi:putative hydrolase of the HAD superfamily